MCRCLSCLRHRHCTALVDNFAALMAALWVTVKVTLLAFFWAVATAVGLAITFTRARLIEMALYPYVITLQVTPVVAIAPAHSYLGRL